MSHQTGGLFKISREFISNPLYGDVLQNQGPVNILTVGGQCSKLFSKNSILSLIMKQAANNTRGAGPQTFLKVLY